MSLLTLAAAALSALIWGPPAAPVLPPFLRFALCNGLANQEIGLLHAIAIAREHGLGIVLPSIVPEGRQDLTSSFAPALGDALSRMPFDRVFDVSRFIAALTDIGVPSISEDDAAGLTVHVLRGPAPWASLAASSARVAQWEAPCILGSAPPALLLSHDLALEHVVNALVPAAALARHVEMVRAALGGGSYDALHLRVERDWAPLCALWARTPHSPNAAHCGLLPPDELLRRITATGIGGDGMRVFVAVDEDALEDPAPLRALRSHFNVLTRRDVAAAGVFLPRELGALVDFHVSLGARRWSGNSYSTFSALLILTRQLHSLQQQQDQRVVTSPATLWHSMLEWSVTQQASPLLSTAWYNGATDIPLEHELPLFRTPWAFVLPAEGDLPRGDADAVRIAVWSALRVAHLAPHVLIASGGATPLTHWMASVGVRVSFLEDHPSLFTLMPPHVRASPALLSLLALPLLPSLEGLHHALLTSDWHVIWARRVGSFDLGAPPECAGIVPIGAHFDLHTINAHLSCVRSLRVPLQEAIDASLQEGHDAHTALHLAANGVFSSKPLIALSPAWGLTLTRGFPLFALRSIPTCTSSSPSQRQRQFEQERGLLFSIVDDAEAQSAGAAWEDGCAASEYIKDPRAEREHTRVPVEEAVVVREGGEKAVASNVAVARIAYDATVSFSSSYAPSYSSSSSYAPSYVPSISFSSSSSYAPSYVPSISFSSSSSYAPSFAPSFSYSASSSYAPSFAPSFSYSASSSYAPSFAPSFSYSKSYSYSISYSYSSSYSASASYQPSASISALPSASVPPPANSLSVMFVLTLSARDANAASLINKLFLNQPSVGALLRADSFALLQQNGGSVGVTTLLVSSVGSTPIAPNAPANQLPNYRVLSRLQATTVNVQLTAILPPIGNAPASDAASKTASVLIDALGNAPLLALAFVQTLTSLSVETGSAVTITGNPKSVQILGGPSPPPASDHRALITLLAVTLPIALILCATCITLYSRRRCCFKDAGERAELQQALLPERGGTNVIVIANNPLAPEWGKKGRREAEAVFAAT